MGAIANDYWKVTLVGAGGAAVFPAAAALADNTANPTTTSVGAFLHGWDATGSVWDRVRVSDGTNGNLAVAIRSGTSIANVSGLGDGEGGVTILSVGNRGSRLSDATSAFDRERSWTGTHANAWSAAAVGVNGTSTAVDFALYRTVSVFGNSSAMGNIIVQFSQNNATYYDGPILNGGGAGDFAATFDHGARYVRLKSSAAATITATIAGKGI